MNKHKKKVLIITVSYNSSEFLERAIRSAFTQKYAGGITVCLLDNASRDTTWELAQQLKSEFSNLEIIHLDKNTGFAGGNNYAIQQFIANHDYFYLHNPDAYFMNEHTIADLVSVMEEVNDAGLLQPIVCNPDGSEASTGNIPFYLGVAAMGNKPVDIALKYQKIGCVSGAAMMIPKKIINRIGLLEELYLAYHEDFEYSLRARLAGFENYVAPQIKIYHEHNFSKGAFKFYLMERNRYYQLFTYYDWFSLFVLFPPLLLIDCMITVFFIMNGWFSHRINSYTHVWKNRKILKERIAFVDQFKTKESMLNLYTSLAPKMSTKELAKPGTILGRVFDIMNVFFDIYYKFYLIVYRNVISKIVRYTQ